MKALFFLFFIFLFMSCEDSIRSEDKISTVGKIVDYPVATKNGLKKIIYYYLRKKYMDVSRFDGRYFTYGDRFIMFINKQNPDQIEIPRPTKMFLGIDMFINDSSLEFNTNDVKLLDRH